MKPEILFLVMDYYHANFDYSNYNNKENVFRQATEQGFQVYVSSWNNLIWKKSKFYLKRGLLFGKNSARDIEDTIQINPVYINYHVNPIGDHIIVNKYNVDNISFALKKGIVQDSEINDFKFTRKFMDYYISKGYYGGRYSILEPYIYMGKRHMERSFVQYETTGKVVNRPKGFAGNKLELLEELETLYKDACLKPMILKPNTGTRSEGILLIHKDNFKTIIKKLENNNEEWYIAQELITEDLLLYQKKKMTIRLYAFLYSIDPIKFEIYKGGYCYPNKNNHTNNLEDLEAIFLYEKNEPSISLDKYLEYHNISINNFFKEFKNEVRKIFESSKLYYKMGEYKFAWDNTFMLLGFDYLLTKDGIKFIEMNWFPNFEQTTESENKIKMDAIKEYFRLLKSVIEK